MTSRNQSLDVLRAVAVLMVIACHYPLYKFLRGGEFGVDLFFVLSGFLISGILLEDIREFGDIRLGRFFVRRAFKIYPAFYVLLTFTWITFPLFRGREMLHAGLFLQSYYNSPKILNHTWSLAVEEHFYLALPLLLVILLRLKKLHWIPAISLGLLVICFAMRGFSSLPDPVLMLRSHLRADTLFLGVTLGYMQTFHSPWFIRISRPWLIAPALVLISPGLAWAWQTDLPHWQLSALLFLNVIGYSLLVLWAVNRQLRAPMVAFIGKYSYSIYLWHFIVTMVWRLHPLSLAGLGGAIVTSIAVGIFAATIVEMPFLKIRDSLTESMVRQKSRDLCRIAPLDGKYATSPAVQPVEDIEVVAE